jgi:hypothetical protein
MGRRGPARGGGGGVDGVKNRSGQWEGPGGGELNGCIMHQVHTNINESLFFFLELVIFIL